MFNPVNNEVYDKEKLNQYDMKNKNYSINNNNHDSSIEDLLSINDNTFISCSYDRIIKVWKY